MNLMNDRMATDRAVVSPLYRSVSETELVSFAYNEFPSTSNIWLSYSWPILLDANDMQNLPPPDYNQLCNYERNLNSGSLRRKPDVGRYSRSISLKDNVLWTKDKTFLDTLDAVRKENLILTNTVLKNNEDIKCLMEKYQKINSTLADMQKEDRTIEKKSNDLEEKLHLNIKETKLIYDDMEQMKKDLNKLKHQYRDMVINSNSNSNSNSICSTNNSNSSNNSNNNILHSPHSPGDGSSFWTYSNQTTGSSNSSAVSGASNVTIIDSKMIQQRLEQMEFRLKQMAEQNADVLEQIEHCLFNQTVDEDLNKKFEQKFQYINDMNQLLQLKVNMLESKLEHHQQQQQQLSFNDCNNSNINSNKNPSTTRFCTGAKFPMSPQTVSDTGAGSVAPVAYVAPNIRTSYVQPIQPPRMDTFLHPNHEQRFPIRGILNQPIIINGFDSTTTPTASLATVEQQQQFNPAESHCSHHRRCRRSHKIKLFPPRRTKH